MKIIVLVKQVPNTSDIKIDHETNTLIRKGVESIINPDDLAGVEEALKLKEKYGGQVITVTMGPKQAEEMIHQLYGLGVDHAYLLSDGKFAGSDTYSTSTILSSFLKTLEYDLIIAGYQALDGDTAQVGPQVAEMLSIPQVTHVNKVNEIKNNVLEVEKSFEEDLYTLQVQLPALITTIKTMNKPRLMNAWDVWQCFDKEYTTITFNDLDIPLTKIGLKGSPTKVSKTTTKQVTKKSEKEVVTPKEAANIILSLLYPYIGGNK